MGYLIGLLIFGGAWFGISRSVYELAISPEAIALLPPSPEPLPEPLPAPSTQPAPVVAPRPITSIDIDLKDSRPQTFDWAELTDADAHPHILILGKTGAGKTTLARRLLADWGGNALVVTPHAKPGEWGQIAVKGAGRNYDEIERTIAGLADEMDRRYQLYAGGVESYPVWSIVLDEVPAIMANCPAVSTDLKALAREARKVKMRLILLSHGGEVKTLGIEGEGSVRESFTRILLRGFQDRLPESVGADLAKYPYPCLVNGVVADIDELPDLPTMTPLQERCNPIVEATTATTAQRLEALYNGPAMEPQQRNNAHNEPLYTPDNLSHQQALERIQQLKQSGLSQTKIIETLWSVKAGSNRSYESARAEYKTITGE